MKKKNTETSVIPLLYYSRDKLKKYWKSIGILLYLLQEKRESLNIDTQNTDSIKWLFSDYPAMCYKWSQRSNIVLGKNL